MNTAGFVESVDIMKEGIADLLVCCKNIQSDEFGVGSFN